MTGHGFQPHCLPYSGDRCIPNTFRAVYLFSTRLIAVIRRIPYLYNQLVITLTVHRCRYVERKRSKTSGMATNLHIIYPHICFPVYSTKMQQYPLFFPCLRHTECTPIPELSLCAYRFSYSRKRRFYRKRNQNLSVKTGRYPRFTDFRNCIIPQTVQIFPVIANHYRPGIFR